MPFKVIYVPSEKRWYAVCLNWLVDESTVRLPSTVKAIDKLAPIGVGPFDTWKDYLCVVLTEGTGMLCWFLLGFGA